MGDAADAQLDDLFHSYGGEGESSRRRPAQRVTCKRCSQEDLRWQNVKGGLWRLHNTAGEVHSCRPAIERVRNG